MKQKIRQMTVCSSIFFLGMIVSYDLTDASLAIGNRFKPVYWTADTNGSVKNSCSGYIQIHSKSTKNRYGCGMWLGYSWWKALFPRATIKTEITTCTGKPAAISKASPRFSTIEWFTGYIRTGSKDTLRFFFPMLPQNISYGKYDYFSVGVNDTLSLEFYGAGTNIMTGTFVHKKPTATGTIRIIACNAFIIELTNANPFRIKSIWCKGEYLDCLNQYLKFNLGTLKKNVAWYGIDITGWINLAKTTDTFENPVSPLGAVAPSFTPLNCTQGLKILYTLPTGVNKIDISLFDLQGRCIRQTIETAEYFNNQGILQLTTTPNPGYYIVQMDASFTNDQTPVSMRKRWTNIR